jgi:hypothetical protein
MRHPLFNAALATLALSSAAAAQTAPQTTPAAPPPRPNCSPAEHRQLDFWIGEWRVFQKSDGVEVGSSTVTALANGCGVSEHYSSPGAPGGPYEGFSYSAYDTRDGKWHQFYVDVNGSAAWFTGALENGSLALYAAGAQPGAQQRMSYTLNTDGTVEQVGVVSTDGGKSWKPGYDYVYRRR